MKTIFPSQYNRGTCSAIILEEGDYKLPVNRFKGTPVDHIFIPEDEVDLYDTEQMNQLISNISIMGKSFGQIFTYKPHEYE